VMGNPLDEPATDEEHLAADGAAGGYGRSVVSSVSGPTSRGCGSRTRMRDR
jgi:hypothetical protein